MPIDATKIPKIPDELFINGVRVNSAALMGIMLMIFNPDPEMWYRFEKQGDALLVERRQAESADTNDGIIQ
jgi:hypothetical protein